MIGKMTLEGHFKKKGMIEMITPKSFSKLLGILGDKEKCIKSDEFNYSKKTVSEFLYQCKILSVQGKERNT
jgi:hypothetical protein